MKKMSTTIRCKHRISGKSKRQLFFLSLFGLLLLNSCASWSARPTPEEWKIHHARMEKQRIEINEKLEETYKSWPSLRNSFDSPPETHIWEIELFDEKGRKIGSAISK